MLAFSPLTRRQVLVSLHSGNAFRGVLWAKRGPLLVLRNARLLSSDAPEEGLVVDGEVVVERTQVEYIQVLP